MSVGIRPRVVIQTERTIYVYVYFLRMRYRSLMEDGTGVWKVGACEIKKKKKKNREISEKSFRRFGNRQGQQDNVWRTCADEKE